MRVENPKVGALDPMVAYKRIKSLSMGKHRVLPTIFWRIGARRVQDPESRDID